MMMKKLGIIKLDFNPAFLSFEEFKEDGTNLVITSFYNVKFEVGGGQGPPTPIPLAPDLIARIPLNGNESFDPDEVAEAEILSDQNPNAPPGPPKTTWPNEAITAPDGLFPFDALVVAQGFLTNPFPGRLSAIDLTTITGGDEYIIHQSIGLGTDSRFYHSSVFHDMDGDGLLDIISVRSGARAFPFPPPSNTGELVWFKNPGVYTDKNVEWEESILVQDLGPDIEITKYDFDGDGIPEFLTTHFFTGEKITIYGVSGNGKDWSSVTKGEADIKFVDISTDQGRPFGVQIKDLDGDGHVDILATNHQSDDCTFPTEIPGRVYVIESPREKDMFYDKSQWTTRILLDEIYPQPSMEGSRASRLTPGKALTFYPSRKDELNGGRPWIVVGGDEAGKVWIFRPKRKKGWSYDIEVVFDINDMYGQKTTQTNIPDKPLITISTIGTIAIRYDREGDDGMVEIYIPVFEAQDIHVLSFRKSNNDEEAAFPLEDVKLECPT
eukprot:scaffold421426_cov90-Attheya_sp.AAC.1